MKYSRDGRTEYMVSEIAVEKMAHTSNLTVCENGDVYGVYMANEFTTVEDPVCTDTYIKLLAFNMSDPDAVRYSKIISKNQIFSDYKQASEAPYDPAIAKIDADTLGILFFGCSDHHEICLAKFNIPKFSPADSIKPCVILYQGETVPFDCAGIRKIYTGEGYSMQEDVTILCCNGKIVPYNGELYIGVGCAGDTQFRGLILASKDLVHWRFVSIPCVPVEGGVCEIALCIDGDILYAATRSGWALKYDLVNDCWYNGIRLPNSIETRPFMISFQNRLLVFYNNDRQFVRDNGFVIPRGTLAVYEINQENFSLGDCVLIDRSDTGIHYPFCFEYKNELYMTYSTDRRGLQLEKSISNISLCKVKLKI